MQTNKPAAPQSPFLGGLEYKLGSKEFAWHMQNPRFYLYKNKPKANLSFGRGHIHA